jgi:sugar/nucleoside kinase (ribokinase family)
MRSDATPGGTGSALSKLPEEGLSERRQNRYGPAPFPRSDVSAPERPRPSWESPLDLLVVGHTNLDHFLHVPRLPEPDRTTPIALHETRLGGTAANIARAAAQWGVRTGLVSRVGPDFPAEFREVLEREGVDLRGFEVVPATASSACFIAEDGRGGQSTMIDQGPMRDGVPFRVPAALLAEAPWVHLTTGAPDYLQQVKSEVRRRGGRVAVDPAQEIHYRWTGPALEELLDGSEVFFGNSHEVDRATKLLGRKRWTDLVDLVPLVIRTDGRRGVDAISRTGQIHVAGERPRRISTVVGAGDAFRGGFYAGWIEGRPLLDTLRAGVRSARSWIEQGGVQARSSRRSAR